MRRTYCDAIYGMKRALPALRQGDVAPFSA